MAKTKIYSYRVTQEARCCNDCPIPGTRPGIYLPKHINSPFWNKIRNNDRKRKNQKHNLCTKYRPIQILFA